MQQVTAMTRGFHIRSPSMVIRVLSSVRRVPRQTTIRVNPDRAEAFLESRIYSFIVADVDSSGAAFEAHVDTAIFTRSSPSTTHVSRTAQQRIIKCWTTASPLSRSWLSRSISCS